MILDAITIENFGAYGGKQEAILTPKEGQPIILFGGMNGGGKTTLLDAVQLAFYGPKARLSNRNRLSYKEYLKTSIHRGADPREGASITLKFRRIFEGQTRHFELSRSWFIGNKGAEETIRVLKDGQLDSIFTDHWDETIEAYLPSGISHLFFFDGEQVKELAEGGHSAEILGTAIHSLLGLDLVDRLESDLKIFERNKRADSLPPELSHQLTQLLAEAKHLDSEIENAAMEEGALTNEAGRLAKGFRSKEEQFKAEGGEIFLRRKEIEQEVSKLLNEKARAESSLKELVSGALPLTRVIAQLTEVEHQAKREIEIKRARTVLETIDERDDAILGQLTMDGLEESTLAQIKLRLRGDRERRNGLSEEQLVLSASDTLPIQLSTLLSHLIPNTQSTARAILDKLALIEEELSRQQDLIERIPSEDHIRSLKHEVELSRILHVAKLGEIEALKLKRIGLLKQKANTDLKIEKLSERQLDAKFAENDRCRMLKHSEKVRDTLGIFRKNIIKKHTEKMQSLMLESFQKLLRKGDLVSGLTIDPESFEPALEDSTKNHLSIDRLSAGERQLLATSLLWGLARASGRPIPTIIDTPLGRLDSSHRKHLVERYFPYASHQVLLLSTDEEIVGPYFEAIKPYTARSYLLDYDEPAGSTSIREGYFDK